MFLLKLACGSCSLGQEALELKEEDLALYLPSDTSWPSGEKTTKCRISSKHKSQYMEHEQ